LNFLNLIKNYRKFYLQYIFLRLPSFSLLLNLCSMKAVTILLRSTLALLIIYLSACEKIIDFNKAKNCRIKNIQYFRFETLVYEMDFYYNKWGNPDSIILTPGQMENPNLYFIYNNKKQLVEFQEAYVFGFPALLHRFGYTKGVITTDTTVSNYTQVPFQTITYFKYDHHGRISKSTSIPTSLPPQYIIVVNYQYDGNGNLIRPNQTLNYDNKVNVQLLHPIWQFIARDYSVNNPLAAARYNNFGLPTKFDVASPLPFFSYFPFLGNSLNELGNSEITYDCK